MPKIRHLSDEIFDLLRQLYRPTGPFGRLLFGQAKPIDLLVRMDQKGEIAVIPHLLQYAIGNKNENGKAAARVIHSRMNELSLSGLVDFDERIRQAGIEYPRIWGWGELHPDEIGSITHLSEYRASILGVSSFHSNGYIRERAVLELSKNWTGEELAYLLIRLNDWVSNVRDASAASVKLRLKPEYAGRFVDCLPLIMRLSKRQRIIQTSLFSSIIELLQDDAARPALLSGLLSEDRSVRRACYRVAYEIPGIDWAAVIDLGIRDQDTQIRLWSVQGLRKLNDAGAIKRFLALPEKDAYMPVRREALRLYLTDFPELASIHLAEALLDIHPAVRDEARYHLSKREKMDFVGFYRDALNQDKALYPAICGLGEVGSESDIPLILSYVDHPRNKIRFAAIKSLARIGAREPIDVFWKALSDPSPRVSREAMKGLVLFRHSLNGQRLWDLLSESPYDHTTKHLLALMTRLPKWDSIYYLIKALGSTDEKASISIRQSIEDWIAHFNNSFVSPTAIQKENLATILAKNGDRLGKTIQSRLVFIVKGL